MQPRFSLTWDAEALARAFGVTTADVARFLSDGRPVSFILGPRLVADHPGWSLVPSKGGSHNLRDPGGGLWIVRSITRDGTYFNPSSQVGSSRSFIEADFLAALREIRGFILSDIVGFPQVDLFMVPAAAVRRWYDAGVLGTATRVSRAQFIADLAPQL